eukprot:6181012-Pleurochrysis_carterae.AAC.2
MVLARCCALRPASTRLPSTRSARTSPLAGAVECPASLELVDTSMHGLLTQAAILCVLFKPLPGRQLRFSDV